MAVTAEETYSAPNRATVFLEVPIDDVVPSALNPRKHFAEEPLAELAESIREHGILEPLVVKPFWLEIDQVAAAAGYRHIRPGADDATARGKAAGEIRRDLRAALSHGDGYRIQARLGLEWIDIRESYRAIALIDGLLAELGPAEGYPITTASLAVRPLPKYELIAGERRWRASKMAGLTHVPVVVRDGTDLDAAATMKLMLVENLQRADLDPIEEAAGYRQLADLGMRQKEIAESVNRSQPAIANAMRLLGLPDDVQERIRKGDLTASHGVAIASWKHLPHVASKLAEVAAANHWTTKQTEDPFGQYWAFVSPLVQAKLVRELYEALFDRKVCQKCPFEAYRNPSHGAGLCFKPEHYDELQEAAKSSREAERQAKIQAALSKATEEGTTLPKLSELSTGSYELLDQASRVPAGCRTQACACRGEALGYDGDVIPICTDPVCYRKLKAADTRASNKAGREHATGLLESLEMVVDGLHVLGVREMAVIATLALQEWHSRQELETVCQRQGVTELISALRNDGYDGSGKRVDKSKNYRLLSECSTVELARVVLETVIRSEIKRRYFDRATSESPVTDWYLEGKGE